MKNLKWIVAFFVLCFAIGYTIKSKSQAAPAADRPGSLVLNGNNAEYLVSNGCLAFQNNVKKPTCEFRIWLAGVKINKPVMNVEQSEGDTLLNLEYASAVATTNPTTPNTNPGDTVIPQSSGWLGIQPNGCFASINFDQVKSPKCSGNIVLRYIALSNVSCSLAEKGGNTLLTCDYDKKGQRTHIESPTHQQQSATSNSSSQSAR